MTHGGQIAELICDILLASWASDLPSALVLAQKGKDKNQIGKDIYSLQISQLPLNIRINSQETLIQRKRYNINTEIPIL